MKITDDSSAVQAECDCGHDCECGDGDCTELIKDFEAGRIPENLIQLATRMPDAVLEDLDVERAYFVKDLAPFQVGAAVFGANSKPDRLSFLLTAERVEEVGKKLASRNQTVARLCRCVTCGRLGLVQRCAFRMEPGEEFTAAVAQRGKPIPDYCRLNICPACRAWSYAEQVVFPAMLLAREDWDVVDRRVTIRVRGGDRSAKVEAFEVLRTILDKVTRVWSKRELGTNWITDPVNGPRDGATGIFTAVVPRGPVPGARRYLAVGEDIKAVCDAVVAGSTSLRKLERSGLTIEYEWTETRVLASYQELHAWAQELIAGPSGWQDDTDLLADAAVLSGAKRFRANAQWVKLREACRARPREPRPDVTFGVKVDEPTVRRRSPEMRLKAWRYLVKLAAALRCVALVTADGRWVVGADVAAYARGQLIAESSLQALEVSDAQEERRRRGVPEPPPVSRRDPGSVWVAEYVVPEYAM